MNFRTTTLALRVALAGAGLVSCAGSPAPRPSNRSTTLRVGVPLRMAAMSPAAGRYLIDAGFDALVFDGLTTVDDSGDVRPALAQRWVISPDGRDYRFTLRRQVHFHDGQPFTASDVVVAWQSALRQSTTTDRPWMLTPIAGATDYASGRASRVTGLQAIDDSTLGVRLSAPLAPFLAMLSMPQAAIASAQSTDTHPIGTGPWRWTSGAPSDSIIRLARNPDHWRAPKLDSLEWIVIADSSIGTAMRHGLIDYAFDVTPASASALSSSAEIGFVQASPTTLVHLIVNHRAASLKDARVRNALCMAIDAEALQRTLGVQRGLVAAGPVPPNISGHDAQLHRCRFDPAAAASVLRQAGYPMSRPITIGVGREGITSVPPQIGRQIAHFLEAAGLHAIVRERDDPFVVAADSLDDLMVAAWFPDYPDGDSYLYPLFHSSAAGLISNRGGWTDSQTDRLLEASRTATTEVDHDRLLRAAAARITEQRASIPLWFERPAIAYSLRLSGWMTGRYPSTFSEVKLADSLP